MAVHDARVSAIVVIIFLSELLAMGLADSVDDGIDVPAGFVRADNWLPMSASKPSEPAWSAQSVHALEFRVARHGRGAPCPTADCVGDTAALHLFCRKRGGVVLEWVAWMAAR